MNTERLETGVIQDEDDWPGAFIRGDECFFFVDKLKHVLSLVPQEKVNLDISDFLACTTLKALISLLERTDVGNELHNKNEVQHIKRVSKEDGSPQEYQNET